MGPSALDKIRTVVTALFGIAVIASGLWRFFSAEGGHNGLWFGIVMGGLALLASGLFATGKNIAATIVAWLSILFIGGWFGFEALIDKGIASAEPRQLIVLAVTLVAAVIMAMAPRPHDADKEANQDS